MCLFSGSDENAKVWTCGETGHCKSTELKLKRKKSAAAFQGFDHASVVDFGLCMKQKVLEYFQLRTDL